MGLPFDWAGALIGIELGPLVDEISEQNFKTFLSQKGILCPVTRAAILP